MAILSSMNERHPARGFHPPGFDPYQHQRMGIPSPIFIIVMGVSGAGKSTLGMALAKELGLPYQDGDDLHPAANVEKMSIGTPLDDTDRAPWLLRIRHEGVKACSPTTSDGSQETQSGLKGLVIGCSALKRSYRRVLRGEDSSELHGETPDLRRHQFPTRFVYISGDKEELMRRMTARTGHYMKAEMLNSQLATLEVPDPSTEEGIVTVRLEDSTETQLKDAVAGLEALQ